MKEMVLGQELVELSGSGHGWNIGIGNSLRARVHLMRDGTGKDVPYLEAS